MLLTEYRPFNVDKQLVEASIKANKPLIVTGVLQRANAKNQNERVYPKDILAREMRSYMASLGLRFRESSLNESLNPEVSRKVDSFIRSMADRYDYSMQDAVYAIMAALKQRNYDGLGEHHNDEDFPGKDLSAWDLLDKLKKGNEDLYNKVEIFMKSMDENTTGTGASFNAGSGEGYMTPNAFKKKKK